MLKSYVNILIKNITQTNNYLIVYSKFTHYTSSTGYVFQSIVLSLFESKKEINANLYSWPQHNEGGSRVLFLLLSVTNNGSHQC